ncbi:MAG: protein-L-isoaspartate O-methyltransferase [Candidatus Giovannonibacteria bacterium]|nr:protein-L-isoaspartate O-methyltransferase [Candidatus Giovannonibacteria bacterium]
MPLADMLIKKGVLKNKRLIEAFSIVDRKNFVPENLKEFAYIDEPLPIGKGQTISQPWTVAFMLELLDPKQGENIMEIGYGSGWQTALLASVGANVYAIELVPELCKFGKENFEKFSGSLGNSVPKLGQVYFYCQDGSLGLPKVVERIGGFDKIIVAASGKELPITWKEQLKIGGKIVAPIGHPARPAGGSIFEFIKKLDGKWEEIEHPGFAFVPLVSN